MNDGSLMNRWVNHRLLPPPFTLAISIKNTLGMLHKMINNVIDNGEKINGTYAGGQRQSEKCKSVVEYGTKNPTD